MKIKQIFALCTALLFTVNTSAQDIPNVNPKATYTDSEGVEQTVSPGESINAQAPLVVLFQSNPENTEGYTMNYKWTVTKEGKTDPDIVRYEEATELTFNDSGTHLVKLTYTYTDSEGNLITPEETYEFSATIEESKLEFPNAFSPESGNDRNRIFCAKIYQSIVEFEATIFNRWGQKIYSWSDPAGGWDGTFNGKDAKAGVYYLLVKAKGADGRTYNIRRDVNLFRGYKEGSRLNQ